MIKNDLVLQEHRELIVGLGQVVIELFMRVLALEAVLQKRGALSPKEIQKMAHQIYKAFPSSRTSAGAQVELASLEAEKRQTLERLREMLVRFEGPSQ